MLMPLRRSDRAAGERGCYNETMGKRFSTSDLSRITDDKALAIAAFGESVAAYRYIVLSEKARDAKLRGLLAHKPPEPDPLHPSNNPEVDLGHV